MIERRSAAERHYLLADGTYRAEVYLQPIHYKAPAGSWQRIATSLTASVKDGFAFSNETNTLKTYLPATAGAPVRVEAGTGALTFQLLGGFNGPATVQGNHVAFTDSQNNASISYAVEPGQLKELITLTAPGSAPTYRYAMHLEGLTATLKPDKSVRLADATGKAVMCIAAPWMVDATGKSSGRVKVVLTPTEDGQDYTIVPDATWLASARYPVTIDPTITATLSWTASDAVGEYQVNSFWSPGFDYYGDYSCEVTGPYLAVGAPYAAVPYRSLLCFSISGLPSDSEIQSATLTMIADHATGDPNLVVQIYHINKTLDPNGSPAQYPTPNNIGITKADLDRYPSVLAPLEPNFWGAYKTFDATGLVQSWSDARSAALNLMLRDIQEDLNSWQRSSATVFFSASSGTLAFTYTTPTRPDRAWSMTFKQPDRTPANATAMPALADIGLDGTLEAAVPMGTINGANWPDPSASNNPNKMWVIKDLTGSGGYGTMSGWPRPLRDGPAGVALADFVPTSPTNDGHLEVLATNSQDINVVDPNNDDANVFSHLYVWRDAGTSVAPFAPYNLDSIYGKGYGHSYAAPVVFDTNSDGIPEALFSCSGQRVQNQTYELGGNIQGVKPSGLNLFKTSFTTNDPWFTYSGPNESEFYAPPVVMEDSFFYSGLAGASVAGSIYSWQLNGTPVSGFPISISPLPVYSGICAADIDGQGTSVIIAATGDVRTYWYGYPDDGAVFCWDADGTLRWRYPALGANPETLPTMQSGVAVGRIFGNDYPPCVVVADAAGTVYALDPLADDSGRVIWTYTIPSTGHPFFNGVKAQPLIVDVSGDGIQDVVIGTTNGEIYALDGLTGAVHWKHHTFLAPSSVWYGVYEQHHEEVVGLAIGNLRYDSPSNATILVTSGRAAVTNPSPVGGHMLILDCEYGTYSPSYADWPQYQKNSQRLGLFVP